MRNSPIKKTKPDHEIRLRGSFRTVNTGRLPRTWEVWGGVSQEEGAARTKALERTELGTCHIQRIEKGARVAGTQ